MGAVANGLGTVQVVTPILTNRDGGGHAKTFRNVIRTAKIPAVVYVKSAGLSGGYPTGDDHAHDNDGPSSAML